MKRLLLTTAMFLWLLGANAADIIVLTNNTRIDAKITEVSDTEIKYKKVSNPDGPAFVIKTEQISSIIYDNGEVQTFANHSNQQTANNEQTQPQQAEPVAADPNQKKNTIQFNPQPSDNLKYGIILGYVSKNIKATGYAIQGSFLAGEVDAVSPAIRFGFIANPTYKYGIGFRSGVYMEYAIEKDNVQKSNNGNRTIHDIAFSVPIQLSYRYELIPNLSFTFYTGPVFDLGIYTFEIYSSSHSDDLVTEPEGNKYYPNTYNGFNALWGVGGGVQWKQWRLDIGGEFGMMNKTDKTVNVTGKWNKPVYISVTCLF